ncbi:MAG TPA: hypothetical protein VE219_06470, partial [Candidatus Sulfotelmatobacter sp.]|nr:hypothetical protein [Candidatus Sulfotelmatobacter sp.]
MAVGWRRACSRRFDAPGFGEVVRDRFSGRATVEPFSTGFRDDGRFPLVLTRVSPLATGPSACGFSAFPGCLGWRRTLAADLGCRPFVLLFEVVSLVLLFLRGGGVLPS